jgi:PPE-repeat protein
MTVPPPVIAANRVLLAQLIATNFFGQNTPAIAVTEAQYMEMWAQDATAMYGYAASSAVASDLDPVPQAPNTTSPDAQGDQALAVAQAAEQPASNTAQTLASNGTAQLASVQAPTVTTQAAVTQAASTTTTPGPFTWLQNTIQDFLTYGFPTPSNNWTGGLTAANFYTPILKNLTGLPYFGVGQGAFGYQMQQQLTFGLGSTAGGSGAWFPTPQFAGLFLGATHGGGTAASAHLASAAKIGGLSVPNSWGLPAAEGALGEQATKAVTVNFLAHEGTPGTNGILQGMPMTGGARRGAAGFTHKYGFKHSVLTRPPSAG